MTALEFSQNGNERELCLEGKIHVKLREESIVCIGECDGSCRPKEVEFDLGLISKFFLTVLCTPNHKREEYCRR